MPLFRATATALGLLLVVAVGRVRADDDLAPLVEQLFTSDVAPALEAGDRLRAIGARAREALERRIDPDGALDRMPPLSGDEADEVDDLVDQLGDPRFATREHATSELIKKGLPALRKLRAAAADGDAERRTRAKHVIDTLLPPSTNSGPLGMFPRIQAILMVGWIGERDSIPALRHALADPAPEVAAAADGALRIVLGGGPAAMPLQWHTQPNELRAAWERYLAAAVPSAADPVECRFAPLAAQCGRPVLGVCHQEWQMDSTGAGFPGPKRTIVWRAASEEICQSSAHDGPPPRFERRYQTHRWARATEGFPDGMGPPLGGVELSGQALAFTSGEDGRLTSDDPVWTKDGRRPLMVPGELVMAGLPAGALRPGALVPLPEELAQRIGSLLHLADAPLEGPRVSQGRMRYLGREDGIDRVYVALGWVGRLRGTPPCEILLQGTLEIDAASGLLLAHDLFGPLWVCPQPRAGSVVLGEQRFEAVVCAATLPSAGAPALDRALATLLTADLSGRVAAARELRAAGNAIRPVLERILRPDAGDAAVATAVSAQIHTYLSAGDAATRPHALVGLLRGGGPARRAVLDRLATADADTALALRALDVRLWPFESAATQAALLLATVGTVDSVPALRAALRAGSAQTAAAADHALRAIVGEGPASGPANPLHGDRAALLAGWDARLGGGSDAEVAQRLGTWTGPAIVQTALHASDSELASRLQCHLAVRIASSAIPGLAGDTVITTTAEGRFRRVAGVPLRLEGRLESYKDRVATAVRPQPLPLELERADAALWLVRPDALAFTVGGKRVASANPAVLPIAMLWADLLPAGEYAVGATRELTPALADRLRMALAIPPAFPGKVVDAAGRLRYLGRVDGRDRFAFTLVSAIEVAVERIVDASALAGVIVIDPTRALVVHVDLAGPGWGQIGNSTAVGWTAITEDEVASVGK